MIFVFFKNCGFNASTSAASDFGYQSFTYEDRSGFKNKVFYDGKAFAEQPISINGLDYIEIKTISDKIGVNMESFRLYEPESAQNWGNTLKIEDFILNKNKKLTLYTVDLIPAQYFLFEKDDLLFSASDIISMEAIKNDSIPYPDIKTYALSNYKMTADTMYYTPSIYTYSKKAGRYLKK
jgi:hypothetical protein